MKLLRRFIVEIVVFLFAMLFVSPVFFMVMNSMKSQSELFNSFIALPSSIDFSNYVTAFKNMDFITTFTNSLIATVISVGGIVILSSMLAYKIVRMNKKWGAALLIFFVMPMMIPFQTIMIPLMKVISFLHLQSNLIGYILACIGLIAPFTIYLYRGFIAQLPIQLEEAAYIDGANTYQTFFMIVFPLLKPVTITAIILNGLWVWNEFILSLLMLQREEVMTIQLTVYKYIGAYNQQWNLALATLVLATLPIVIFYMFMQKQIENNMIAGSLKG